MESVKRETSTKCIVFREQKSDGASDGAFVSSFCVLVREAHKRSQHRSFANTTELWYLVRWDLHRILNHPWAATHENPPQPGSRKVNDGSKRKGHGGEKQWKECAMIEEEGLLDDGERDRGVPRRYYVLAFIVGFFILFGLFSLILYGAAKPQKPKITVKSITFETLKIQAGQDAGGVGTDMITMNATLRMLYRNTGTFFGVHVTSTPVDLSFSQMKIGSGSIKKFYQSRKSQRTVLVHVIGERIPLYGSGATLIPPAPPAPLPKPKRKKKGAPVVIPDPPAPPAPVPMKLSFVVRSRAYVLGRLVKPKFLKKIECDINFEHKNLNKHIPITKNCTVTTV